MKGTSSNSTLTSTLFWIAVLMGGLMGLTMWSVHMADMEEKATLCAELGGATVDYGLWGSKLCEDPSRNILFDFKDSEAKARKHMRDSLGGALGK